VTSSSDEDRGGALVSWASRLLSAQPLNAPLNAERSRSRLSCGLLIAAALCSCTPSQEPPRERPKAGAVEQVKLPTHEFISKAMGTTFKVTLVGQSFIQAKQLARVAFHEVDRIERRVSSWIARSEIGRLNRAGGDWSPLSAESHWLLSRAQDLNALTQGSFDVTWAALKGLWDFRAAQLPKRELLLKRLGLVGAQHLSLRGPQRAPLSLPPAPLWMTGVPPESPLWREFAQENTEVKGSKLEPYGARLTQGSKVDLGGIAKGYALDSIARLLLRFEARDFLVDGGGDLLAYGRSPQAGQWSAGVRHPRSGELFLALTLPSGWSVVTSGDYERYFMLGGQRYHHIIDLRTGYPSQGTVAVTLLAREATMADALATGMMALGAEEGYKIIEELEGVEGLWMSADGSVHYSSGFRRFCAQRPTRWLSEAQ